MKSVLISIQPKWCELIASGKKTVEIRKTRPKLDTPFKCYIYCTKEKPGRKHQYEAFGINGKPVQCGGYVVAEFVCDEIRDARECFIAPTCLTTEEWLEYTNGYKTPVWGWHISDLKIYDEPKELSEFTPNCKYMLDDMRQCDSRKIACSYQALDHNPWPDCSVNAVTCERRMQRPPQSWCYVEEA